VQATQLTETKDFSQSSLNSHPMKAIGAATIAIAATTGAAATPIAVAAAPAAPIPLARPVAPIADAAPDANPSAAVPAPATPVPMVATIGIPVPASAVPAATPPAATPTPCAIGFPAAAMTQSVSSVEGSLAMALNLSVAVQDSAPRSRDQNIGFIRLTSY
jgi:hypothetical protein